MPLSMQLSVPAKPPPKRQLQLILHGFLRSMRRRLLCSSTGRSRKKYFSKQNPIGKHLGASDHNPNSGGLQPGYLIIGVVGDTKYSELRREIKPGHVFSADRQQPSL